MIIQTRELPLASRLAPIGDVSKELRTVDVTWSTGSRVKRYDFWKDRYYYEELSTDPKHVRMARLESGAPVLDSHQRWSVRDVIGVVENAKLGKRATATLRFSERAEVEPIVQDIRSGILKNVSVGYATYRTEELPADDQSEGLPIYRATDWEPMEISLVPIGADPNAGMRQQDRKFSCEFVYLEERDMPNETAPAPAPVVIGGYTARSTTDAVANPAPDSAAAQPAAPDLDAIRKEASEGERKRSNDIRLAVRAAKLDEKFAEKLISDGVTIDKAREMIIDSMAEESAKYDVRSATDMHIARDEVETRREGMETAMLFRMAPSMEKAEKQNPDGRKRIDMAREYRHMSFIRMAEESLRQQGIRVGGLSPLEIATRALHTTSDLPGITANVLNKRLRAAYEQDPGTYRLWARQAPNLPDFKPTQLTQLSAMPDLLLVLEHGEFTYGVLTDGKETYNLLTYGRIIGVTRQLLINDDMRALDRIASGFGFSAARLENRTVYAQLTSNPVMSDGVTLFHANHENLAASGAVISDVTLGAARTAMRTQQGLAGEDLNIVPVFLIVPAALEQIAYKWTSSDFVPATPLGTNEFRAGGRTALTVIVDPTLDANSTTAWYLAASTSQVDTVEYAFLEGNEGVFIDTMMEFDIDGMKTKARLDFAAKVVDWRGLFKNPGA